MNNNDRVLLIKERKEELAKLEAGKKEIMSLIKDKKEEIDNLTNNIINELLKEK